MSAKALRLYEERGLLTPARNPAGWRIYGPEELRRGADVVALRALGLGLAQVAAVLQGEGADLEGALATHQSDLECRARQLVGVIERVRGLRASLARGEKPSVEALTRLHIPVALPSVEFPLPWPWGGELFRWSDLRPINYIVGPLGSGKTRLAMRLAEVLSDATFLGLDRARPGHPTSGLAADAVLGARVDRTLVRLVADGAIASEALIALLVALEAESPTNLVIDMVEQGLDADSQRALMAHLRSRSTDGRQLFMLTRSSVILDLAAVGSNESILLCPANHSPPSRVSAFPGSPGYEAVATCLGSPEVRARTEGVIAWRPPRGNGSRDLSVQVAAARRRAVAAKPGKPVGPDSP